MAKKEIGSTMRSGDDLIRLISGLEKPILRIVQELGGGKNLSQAISSLSLDVNKYDEIEKQFLENNDAQILLEALRENNALKELLSPTYILSELYGLYRQCLKSGKESVAVKALEMIGRESGMFASKTESHQTIRYEALLQALDQPQLTDIVHNSQEKGTDSLLSGRNGRKDGDRRGDEREDGGIEEWMDDRPLGV